jgi:hypothetical protein
MDPLISFLPNWTARRFGTTHTLIAQIIDLTAFQDLLPSFWCNSRAGRVSLAGGFERSTSFVILYCAGVLVLVPASKHTLRVHFS